MSAPSYMTDPEGKPSAMRAMSMTTLVFSIAAAVGGLLLAYRGLDYALAERLCVYFLVAAFGGKGVQKFLEQMGWGRRS